MSAPAGNLAAIVSLDFSMINVSTLWDSLFSRRERAVAVGNKERSEKEESETKEITFLSLLSLYSIPLPCSVI